MLRLAYIQFHRSCLQEQILKTDCRIVNETPDGRKKFNRGRNTQLCSCFPFSKYFSMHSSEEISNRDHQKSKICFLQKVRCFKALKAFCGKK